MKRPLKFLCVHQGSELYGSDRMFIHSVVSIHKNFPNAEITVHLPEAGLLLDEIKPYAKNVIIGDMLVLRRKSFSFKALSLLPVVLKNTVKRIKEYDVVYINTLTVLSYLLVTRFAKKECILHIHEISTGVEKYIFRALIKWSKCFVIYNSQATQKSFRTKNKSICIHNGITIRDVKTIRAKHTELRLLVIGRLNSWKGQDLAVQAMNILQQNKMRNVRLRIVGSSFLNNLEPITLLRTLIKKFALQETVELIPFTQETEEHYKWADIVIVPSRKPEPFGLVALEGMNYQCPIIAANHGGLTEIVQNNETGLLFKPNNAQHLAECMRTYYVHTHFIEKHGLNGYNRLKETFDIQPYQQQFSQVIADHVV